MNNLVISAPLQNTALLPDQALGRIVPLYVAEQERNMEDQPYSVHLWNNVVASQQGLSHTEESFKEQQKERLIGKYACLSMGMFSQDKLAIYTDTDDDFKTWAGKEVEKMVEAGDIRQAITEAYICTACDATISLHLPQKRTSCSGCGGKDIAKAKNELLLISTDAQTIQDTLALSSSPKDVKVLNQALPGVNDKRYVVNKRRLGGINLNNFGFEKDVLDPRIGLGLLSVYVALREGADRVSIIVGRASLHLNTPQFVTAARSQLHNYPSLTIRGIVKAPSNYLMSLAEDEGFNKQTIYDRTFRRIAPQLLKMNNDMSPDTAERLVFSRKKDI